MNAINRGYSADLKIAVLRRIHAKCTEGQSVSSGSQMIGSCMGLETLMWQNVNIH
jgi:hypothetical protein